MIVINKLCKICALCKKDKKLLNRIYNSKYYIPHGDEWLSAIAKDYKDFFSLAALKNHAKKHQFISSAAYNEAMLKKVDEDAEQRVIRKVIKGRDAIQTVIDKGWDRLENDEIKVDTNHLLRASQIQIAAEAKEKDHQLAMIEMIAHFASGSNKNERVYAENTNSTE